MKNLFLLIFYCILSGRVDAQTSVAILRTDQNAGYSSPAAAAPAAAEQVLTYADEMPVFPGGDAGFHSYLARTIKYPPDAWRRNQSGTVCVSFVVDEVGRIRDAAVAKSCGVASLDDEALRLARLMPWWSPGRLNGRAVPVSRTMPIIFRLTRP